MVFESENSSDDGLHGLISNQKSNKRRNSLVMKRKRKSKRELQVLQQEFVKDRNWSKEKMQDLSL